VALLLARQSSNPAPLSSVWQAVLESGCDCVSDIAMQLLFTKVDVFANLTGYDVHKYIFAAACGQRLGFFLIGPRRNITVQQLVRKIRFYLSRG